MSTLLVAVGSFVGFLVAYHTYGRWLSRRIFGLDPAAPVPSRELRDDVDYVPTKKQVIFGHHFTSIAGTGPIVGPAIAVFWGWLPALLWVVFGSIFIGAVHDLGALVVSMRNRGQTVGEVAGRMITPRAKFLFLLILFFALTVVLAIFGLVIAQIFKLYPESVLSVWIAMPVAMAVGWWVYKRNGSLTIPSLISLAILYGAVWVGVYYLPIEIDKILAQTMQAAGAIDPALGVDEAVTQLPWFLTPVVFWTILLLIYCFFASVLPVWLLLQPRDYVNSHQLIVALALLIGGLVVAGLAGKADLAESAPAVVEASAIPADAPPIWPFLFITIACGAVSGFHCLVSSGTSSKQVACEPDAQYVAYGSMLLEGALAVIVILACCAGVGMGQFERTLSGTGGVSYQAVQTAEGELLAGRAAWNARYDVQKGWTNFRLGDMVSSFVDGGANFIATLGVPLELAVGIVAVLVACFAATTLDTATRLQRYVIQELAAATPGGALFTNKFAATGLAVVLGGATAMLRATPDSPPGTGGLILWPLFGAVNQLLAGLAFMVMVFYLWRRNKPIWFAAVPMVVMIVMPAWALLWQMFNPESGWYPGYEHGKPLLFGVGLAVLALQIWMVIEAVLMWPRARGVLEQQLPPLKPKPQPQPEPAIAGGRS